MYTRYNARKKPDRMPEYMPDRRPEHMPKRKAEYWPDRMPESRKTPGY